MLDSVLHRQHTRKNHWLLAACLTLSGVPLVSPAAPEPKIEQNTQEFGVKLGATRVIYAPDSMGQTLSVSNPQNYPMLVQSRVYAEDMQSKAPFVVTPPLFRLDGLQQSNLRIVRTGGTFANDRESLQWLCVKGIPPKADDLWAKDKTGRSAVNKNISLNLQLSINSCIKLFVRPDSLKGHPEDVASSLTWSRQGKQLQAVNDTPFYMNLASLKVGSVAVADLHYVPPFSSSTFPFPNGASGKVTWSVVTDYGGVSPVYQAEIKSSSRQ
ncbi:fimbria/pilus periplasmic chaperone [Edwardsiella hoshinae]|uniref:fimbria/pilus periplasmic chaperone n=1 Tax=Edwardsiella hoshinae TaxID=93378 RepID=UPI0009F2FB6C|nr:fimbria/pilus periplasmic chaperone [Edwardsiella hoshinae]